MKGLFPAPPEVSGPDILDEDKKKRADTVRDYLLAKREQSPASAPVTEDSENLEEPVDDDRQFMANLVSNLGSAVEGFGRAASVARGGQRDDGSFYKNITEAVNSRFDRDRREAKEKKEAAWTDKVRGFQSKEMEDALSIRERERSPDSQESELARELAKRMMPSKDFSGMTANQLKTAMPTIEKLYEKEMAKRRAQQEAAEASEKRMRENFKDTQTLRKEYNSHPTTKSTNVMSEAYAKITSTEATGPGDMSLVFSYMKVLDPTSVVREREFQAAAESGGVPSTISALYNKVKGEGMLDEKTRREIRSQAKALLNAQLERQRDTDTQFHNIATRQGFDWEEVRGSFASADETSGRSENTPATPEQVEEIKDVVKQHVSKDKFPLIITRGTARTTVENEDELAEALSEGWKIQGDK